MIKRTVIIVSLTVVMIVGLLHLPSVSGMLMTDAEIATLDAAGKVPQERRDNAIARVLKAPFKAIGRLFGRGRKNDNKLHRLTEKDVEKFASTPTTRLINASARAEQTSNPDMAPTEHLEQGRILLEQGNLNEAISELSLASSKDPKLAEAYNLLGVAYSRKGLVELARDAFEKSLKIDKNSVQTLNNLGYFLYNNGNYKDALERLKKAARLAPDDPRILNNLALTQSQLGKFDEAYKNFVRAGGEIEGRLNTANRLEIAGRTEEAQRHFEEARIVAEAQQKRDVNAQVITVTMEIKNGRVTYASVQNRRPGLERYEASAMRIARLRRYPADKNGSESVVIRVSPPGS